MIMNSLFGYSKRKNNTTVPVVAAVIASLLLVITSAVPSYVSASTGSSPVNSTLTPNQLAAGGPLPGNFSLVEGEQECLAKSLFALK